MQKAHQNINWENKPSTETPINETNLNLMDRSIDTIDDRVVTFDTTKANQSDLLQGVRDVTFTSATGTFHITYFNGTIADIDTDIEKVIINFYYDSNPQSPHYQCLVLTLDDGTIQYIDLSALITQYEFTNSSRIAFTVGSDGSISADIVGGSITDDKMQPNYLADITAQANAGAQSAINASGFKLDAEAWAVGTRNGQAVPQSDPAWHNNSRYWASQANVTSLVALTDVSIDNPQDMQYLGYDATEEVYTLMDIPQANPGVPIHFVIISEEGSSVTVTKPDGDTITPTHTSAGQWECDVFTYGVYQVDAVLSGDDAQVSVNVDDCKIYVIDDSHFHASIVVTYPTGATVSCVKTGEPTQYATSSPYTFVVHSLGEYTITGTRNGITEVQTVTITASEQVVNITLTILPDGSTITPTDDVQILLNCADIWDKAYTAIFELIADDTSLLTVLTSDNAIDYLVRSTTFASAITADADAMAMIGSYDYASDTLLADSTWATAIAGSTYAESVVNVKVPAMTSNTTPSGVCSASSSFQSYDPYKAFDNNWTSSGWTVSGSNTSGWVQYEFPSVVTIHAFKYKYLETGSPANPTWQMKGSNDGTNFTNIGSSVSDLPTNTIVTESVSNSTSYKYIRMDGTASTGMSAGQGYKFQFYGRENGGVQTWLRSGGITDKTYTTLAEVLADTTTLSALIANHDAVDYLVTAKAFIDGIVADATAMSYIGLNNYCANTLLADAEWLKGIVNSTYKESVLNVKVPAMTGYNTPSGLVFCNSENYGAQGRQAWKAFDSDTSTSSIWMGSAGSYCGYDFERTVKIYVCHANAASATSTSGTFGGLFESSTDNDTWNAFNEEIDYTGTGYRDFDSLLAGGVSARYMRFRAMKNTGSSASGLACTIIQFYGREDV